MAQQLFHSLARTIKASPILFTIAAVWSIWLIAMTLGNYWHYYFSHGLMSIAMAAGSFIAGATSEGGGAVAFPVMTLVFEIKPHIARDFSLMIQSVGMTAAAFCIYCKDIRVEKKAVLLGSIGGFIGIPIGLYSSQFLPAVYIKMFFVSIWLSFAFSLYLVNRDKKIIQHNSIGALRKTQTLGLLCLGIIGGMISGIVGSGLDILIFSFLVLYFKLNEKVATPTSVVIMAFNAIAGFFWKFFVINPGISPEAWPYWLVCIPIVVIGAPLGAWFIKNKSRHFIVHLLYLSIAAQYLAALIIIPQTGGLLTFSAILIIIGIAGFSGLYILGNRRILGTSR